MIVAVIAVVAVAGAGVLFRDQIAGAFNSAGNCMNHAVANSAC
jgi:Flp pilus assembly pilin Flp